MNLRKLFLLSILAVSIIVLVSCQASSEAIKFQEGIQEISVAKFYKYGGLNEEYFSTIEDSEKLDSFKKIAESAIKGDNREKRAEPNYDLLIVDKEGGTRALHFFLGDAGEKSFFMYIGHEDKVFEVAPEATSELKNLLKLEADA